MRQNAFIFILAFFLSFFCFQFANNNLMASDKKEIKDPDEDFLMPATLEDLDKHFEKMRNGKFANLDFINSEELNISSREDDNFKYIEISNPGKFQNFKVDIKEGFINIKSESKETKDETREHFQSHSSFASSFFRKLNVPDGVDDKKAEIINHENTDKNTITIKFPKSKITT